MEQHQVDRKLVAILAADVVGYSRLIGVDELGTLKALKAMRRDLIDPVIARHHGNIVKLMGDGLLAEFASAVEAVACAVSIQHGLAERNANLSVEQHIVLRCGINLGDVVVDGKDLYGDGVNVAARLETLCEPGGICISRAVRDQVRDKLPLVFTDRGEQLLKNIARPVRVFVLPATEIAKLRTETKALGSTGQSRRIQVVGAITSLTGMAGAVWWHFVGPTARPLPSVNMPVAGGFSTIPVPNGKTAQVADPRLSMVVLPFASLGGEPDQSYFADALTADVTTDLSRIADSFVIAANTAFTYKERKVDPKQIGQELGVHYILQGSVRRTSNRARVNVELIETTSGTQIWGERFDHDVIDVAAFQDDVTSQIARTLGVELVDAESRRSRQLRPDSPDAVDLAMQGWSIFNQPPDQNRMHEARRLFEGSLSRDPRLVSALVGLASTYVAEADFWAPSQAEDYTSRAEEAVSKALALDPKAAYAHQVKARIAEARLQLPEAIAEAQLAIGLDRNDWFSHNLLALFELMVDHPERSKVLAERALRLSPRDPDIWAPLSLLGRATVALGEPEAAIAPLHQAIASAPTASFLRVFLAAAYGRAGREKEARATIAEFLRASPDLWAERSDAVKTVMRAQLELAARGYYLGTVDGRIGPMNRRALTAFQHEHGIAETGDLDGPMLSLLNLAPP